MTAPSSGNEGMKASDTEIALLYIEGAFDAYCNDLYEREDAGKRIQTIRAAVERLRAENSAALDRAERERDALRARLAEAERDSKRLDWLELWATAGEGYGNDDSLTELVLGWYWHGRDFGSLRSTIDAAMSPTGEDNG